MSGYLDAVACNEDCGDGANGLLVLLDIRPGVVGRSNEVGEYSALSPSPPFLSPGQRRPALSPSFNSIVSLRFDRFCRVFARSSRKDELRRI